VCRAYERPTGSTIRSRHYHDDMSSYCIAIVYSVYLGETFETIISDNFSLCMTIHAYHYKLLDMWHLQALFLLGQDLLWP